MNVHGALAVAVGVAALCLLSSPVFGAAYALPYPADINMSNIATTTRSPPASTPITLKPTLEEEKECSSQIGVYENGVHVSTMRKYDVAEVLEEHGGAPGKLNVTWNMDVPEFPGLLSDTHNTSFWVYNYKSTDFRTYVRLEHALLRNKGQKDQYVDIRGELYWTPPDFCNRARLATYSQDQTGLHSTVSPDVCAIQQTMISCSTPLKCDVIYSADSAGPFYKQCVG